MEYTITAWVINDDGSKSGYLVAHSFSILSLDNYSYDDVKNDISWDFDYIELIIKSDDGSITSSVKSFQDSIILKVDVGLASASMSTVDVVLDMDADYYINDSGFRSFVKSCKLNHLDFVIRDVNLDKWNLYHRLYLAMHPSFNRDVLIF